jgi:hypothetical protein
MTEELIACDVSRLTKNRNYSLGDASVNSMGKKAN